MKSLLFIPYLLGIVFLFTSCTENSRAKKYGGTATIELPKNVKLINVTWKDEELWYLHRPRRDGETIETYSFKENSKWGLIEGEVIFQEK